MDDDDDDGVFEKAVTAPRNRQHLARSYTIDTPQSSYEPPKPSVKDKEPPAASPATGRAALPPTSQDAVDSPARSSSAKTVTPNSYSSLNRSASPEAAPLQKSTVSERTGTAKKVEAPSVVSSSSSPPRPPLSGTQTEVKAPSSGSLHTQAQPSSMEPKPPAVSQVSSSLPRSYQRSDTARLTSVVAPRPFGTQPSRITSLPRGFTVSTR